VDAAKLAEQDPDIRMDAAYALTIVGKFKEAKEQAGFAVTLAPESADAYYNLGSAEAGLGNAKAARHALEQAIELDELHVPALLQLGVVESAGGDDASASKRFLRVLLVEPDNARAKAGLGASLAKLGSDDAKAQKLLEEALHVDPKNVQALALLGDIAERAGKLDEAIRRYDQVRKLRPDDASVKKHIDELKAKKKAAK
jgi:tetratricopeptide (TPR) repeat protein